MTLFEHIERPPYSIPSMAAVRRAERRTGVVVASTFSGAGGTCLGWRLAGADVRYAAEFLPIARETYLANHPDVFMDPRDVREIRPEDVVEACGRVPDVFEGSPPCASFSVSGKSSDAWGREKLYSETRQRTDDLVDVWVELALGIRPPALIMENVAGLGMGPARGEKLHVALGRLAGDYLVDARILKASDYGVAQVRSRLFIQAWRRDLGVLPSWPVPDPWERTLGEALDLAGPSPEEELAAVSFSGYAIEREWRKLGPGENSSKYYNLYRGDRDAPGITVTATHSSPGAASVAHPDEPRKFTPTELRAIFGFPHDFRLIGTVQQQNERIGRSVAPPVARAIASTMIEKLWEARGGRDEDPRELELRREERRR